ncbi:Tim10/DDP family zinc finger-domain-containing protein [Pholiota molesta]|nr:Tim10/DDP family zinc finger-domain-containing protein [Pholiota molesta]
MDQKFDEATQKELATFLEREQAMAKMQSSIQQLTGTCWNKCVTGTPGKYFSSSEQSCLANCVDRFLDSSLFMVKKIEEKRNQSGFS